MNRKPFCHVVLLLTLVKNISCEHRRTKRIVGGVAANFPPYDDPTVFVRFNGRAARVQGSREFPHYVFKGIKYAHPPIGRDRFLRPREKFLEGTVRATTYSPPCVQFIPGKNIVIGSEDCLALNIFTPDLPSGTEGLPVIIWIHGGGFRTGSASQYGVRHLVSKRLVVVTIQYRLGSLGFLSSGSKHLPGNAALWDMALAVQWVRNYIGFFGGNPHRIVVMGHGTGASSALLVALSNIAKGLPNSVIAMSGTAISRWSIDNAPLNTAHAIAEENGCPTASVLTMVKCLQNLPAESIVKGDSNIEFARLQERGFVSGLDGKLGPTPVTEGVNDGRSLPGLVEHDPIRSLHAGDNPKIPLLTGVTKDETKRAVLGQFNSETISKLRQTAENINNKLVESLKSGIGLVRYNRKYTNGSGGDLAQGTQNWIPLEFNNYFKAPTNDISGQLNKIAEVTGDALFNVPAFLTAQFWKGAPAFLYSFEHIGKMNRGSSFLKGIPILGNFSTADAADNSTVGHGDELAYLFEPRDYQGNPLPTEQPTEDDVKVQEIFTQIIADFARHGEININHKKVPAFAGSENNFIQIKPKPNLANKFRFCEMALWTNMGERLKSSYCQYLKILGGLSQSLFGVMNENKGLGGVIQGWNVNDNRNLQRTSAPNNNGNQKKNPLGGFLSGNQPKSQLSLF